MSKCDIGQINLLQVFFLLLGIPVDYANNDGQTALFCACYEKKEKAVDFLLCQGANPNE
jgi:ankyrin repeat protein